MKISKMIDALQQALIEVGDVEFVVVTEVDGNFITEFDRNIAILGIPNEDESAEETVVAIMNMDLDLEE